MKSKKGDLRVGRLGGVGGGKRWGPGLVGAQNGGGSGGGGGGGGGGGDYFSAPSDPPSVWQRSGNPDDVGHNVYGRWNTRKTSPGQSEILEGTAFVIREWGQFGESRGFQLSGGKGREGACGPLCIACTLSRKKSCEKNQQGGWGTQ